MQVKQINLHNLMSSAEFKKKVDYIRGVGEQRLYEAIWDNVYANYDPIEYERTYQLLNSVTSSYKMGNNSFEIRVFCDPEKMHHIANKPYGMPVYVPVLTDDGHTQKGFEGTNDMYHDYPKRDFLNIAIKKIEQELQQMLITAIITVTASRNRKAY